MRQAGRSLPEYRQSRAGVDMLEACLRPELAAEITLQPVRRHGVDAAVFFSDIVTPVLLAGVDVSIVAGRGPVLAEPVRTASDVLALRPQFDAVLLVTGGGVTTDAQIREVETRLGTSTPLLGVVLNRAELDP